MLKPTVLWTKQFWINTVEAAGVAFAGAALAITLHAGTAHLTSSTFEQAGEAGAVAALYSFAKSFGVTDTIAAQKRGETVE